MSVAARRVVVLLACKPFELAGCLPQATAAFHCRPISSFDAPGVVVLINMTLHSVLAGVHLLVESVATVELFSMAASTSVEPTFSGTPYHDDVDPTGHISRHNERIITKLDTEGAYIILSNLHVSQRRGVDYERCCKRGRESKY